jgi:hypothetical protein
MTLTGKPVDTLAATAMAPQITISSGYLRAAFSLMAVGGLTAVVGLFLAPERTWSNLLLNNFYLLSIGLAGGLLLSFHFLSGAGWSAGLRRVPEAMMAGLPVMALLVVTLFFGWHSLYEWSRPAGAAALPPDKAFYLSTPFVLLRMLVVLGLWVLLAARIRRVSLAQDEDASLDRHKSLVRYAAIFAVVFALSFSLASVDWLMSLDPHWFSTIFAVYIFAGVLQLGLAVTTLIVLLLHDQGPLRGIVTESHLHDLGKMIFAFSTFWAYIWVSQYLLIWYGNLPEEVTHYLRRTGPQWIFLFLMNLVVNWVLPFVALSTRAAKRSPRVLAAVCVVLLLGRWLDLYLVVMPETVSTPTFGIWEVLIPLGYVGLFCFLIARALAQAPLLPIGDPFLEESLHHHQ